MNPPENAVTLCIDEKSQVQALQRTAPILPITPGVPERQTHDYIRNGTTTLFAVTARRCGPGRGGRAVRRAGGGVPRRPRRLRTERAG